MDPAITNASGNGDMIRKDFSHLPEINEIMSPILPSLFSDSLLADDFLPPPSMATGRIGTRDTLLGAPSFATGFLIHPRLVMTAAHVVAPGGNWKEHLFFQPSFHGGRPLPGYEQIEVLSAFAPPEYFEFSNPGHDYAILLLDRDLPRNLNPYLLRMLPQGAGLQIGAHAVGYPKTSNYINQAKNGGLIRRVTPSYLSYDIPTTDGFSGCAIVHTWPDGVNAVAGIHNASRIASAVSPQMISYIERIMNQNDLSNPNTIV